MFKTNEMCGAESIVSGQLLAMQEREARAEVSGTRDTTRLESVDASTENLAT